MELNKKHRECFIDELQKAKEDLELQQHCLETSKLENLKERWEIHIFLAQQRVRLIEQSLIDNEIDF